MAPTEISPPLPPPSSVKETEKWWLSPSTVWFIIGAIHGGADGAIRPALPFHGSKLILNRHAQLNIFIWLILSSYYYSYFCYWIVINIIVIIIIIIILDFVGVPLSNRHVHLLPAPVLPRWRWVVTIRPSSIKASRMEAPPVHPPPLLPPPPPSSSHWRLSFNRCVKYWFKDRTGIIVPHFPRTNRNSILVDSSIGFFHSVHSGRLISGLIKKLLKGASH